MLMNEDTKPYKHVRVKTIYIVSDSSAFFVFHLYVNLWVGIVLFSVVRDVLDLDVPVIELYSPI